MARRRRPGRALVALALLVTGIVTLLAADGGVEHRLLVEGPTPVSVYVPEGATVGGAPGVVVAHGFAGSRQLMRSWSLALARAGFVVAVPDLAGHGGSTTRLGEGGASLLADVERARSVLAAQPETDPARIGLLGHSMGSGAVMAYAIERPDGIVAVVAVSPTDAEVSATLPADLLLLAGANEPRFVANARSLLERAGGPSGSPGDGAARRLIVVPRVEHVSILFSPSAQEDSVAWLAAALQHVPLDRRAPEPVLGWLILVLGVVFAWQALAMRLATTGPDTVRRRGAWLTLLAGGLAATASLVIVSRSVAIGQVTGVLVAGEVALWFLLTGLVWLRFGVRPGAPDGRDAGWALLEVTVLLVVGATASLAWLPWTLQGGRGGLVPVLGLLTLPFTLAAAAMLQGRRGRSAVGTWLGISAVVVIMLGIAAFTVPGVGFLVLLLPVIPLVLALLVAVAVHVDRPWASALAGSTFLGWLLAVLFPLA
jgi:dienelactone hydrolase